MTTSSVLRIRRTDAGRDQYVIARVEQSSSQRLDLVLQATDGEQVYVTSLRHNELEKLHKKSGNSSTEDWHNIIRARLLQLENSLSEDAVKDVEVVAAINGDLTFSFRKNIKGITQRLGEIVLKPDDETELSVLDWAAEAAARVTALQSQTQSLQAEVGEQSRRVESLQKQLNDAKTLQDSQKDKLLQRFAALLNTKKLKIRDQQRQLIKAGIDPDDDSNVSRRTNGTKGSRDRKRKATEANDPENEDDGGDDDDHAFGEAANLSDATQRTETPEPESDRDLDEVMHRIGATPGSRSQTLEKGSISPSVSKAQEPTKADLSKIPPRRELPFAKSKQQETKTTQKNKASAPAEDDETDDEL
ncbi:Hypothetical protein D9617_5g070880 [Elsinoe fawcettii]|nr:Hypothetical protein D9617_5g070880 [Elsinoe fawcettii]